MTAKEKRLRAELKKTCIALVKETFQTQESFERTISLLNKEISIAVGSLAALGMTKDEGEAAMANLAEHGLEIFRQQFDMTAEHLRQGGRMQ